MPKHVKPRKEPKNPQTASQPPLTALQQHVQRLDYEKHKALTSARATSPYYPNSRARTKISAQGAYRGLRSKMMDSMEEEEDIREEETKERKDEDMDDEEENEEVDDQADEPRNFKPKSPIYLNFRKSKIPRISRVISRENDEELTLTSSVKTPSVEAPVKSKKRSSQPPVLDIEDDEMMASATYLLGISVNFEEFHVHEDTLMPTYKGDDALDFKSFYRDMMNKGRMHADGLGYACHLVKAFAAVVWHRQTKNYSTIVRLDSSYGMASDDAWSRTLTLVTKAVNEKKKDVRVNAEWLFARNSTSIIPKSMKAAQAEEKRKNTWRKEKIQRQLINNERSELISRYKCTLVRCPNYEGGQCFEENGKHYKLELSDINLLNEALKNNNGQASILRLPVDLRKYLKPMTPSGPKGEKSATTVPIMPVVTTAASTVLPTPQSGPMLDSMMQEVKTQMIEDWEERREEKRRQAQLQSVTTIGISEESKSAFRPRSLTMPTLPDASSAAPSAVRPSSPVEGNDLYEYVEWHIQYKTLNSRDVENFRSAYEILADKGYDLQTIQQKKGPEHENWWKKMGIKMGIGHQLARDVSRYGQYKN